MGLSISKSSNDTTGLTRTEVRETLLSNDHDFHSANQISTPEMNDQALDSNTQTSSVNSSFSFYTETKNVSPHSTPVSSSSLFSKEEQARINDAKYFIKHPNRLDLYPWKDTQNLLNDLLSIYRNKTTLADLDEKNEVTLSNTKKATIDAFKQMVVGKAKLLNKPLVIISQTSSREIPEFREPGIQGNKSQILDNQESPTIEKISTLVNNLREYQEEFNNAEQEILDFVLLYRNEKSTLSIEDAQKFAKKLIDKLQTKEELLNALEENNLNSSLSLHECIEQFNEAVELYKRLDSHEKVDAAHTSLLEKLKHFHEEIIARAADENSVEAIQDLMYPDSLEERIILEASTYLDALGEEEEFFQDSKLKGPKNSVTKNLLSGDIEYYVDLSNKVCELYHQLPQDVEDAEERKTLFDRLVSFQQQVIAYAIEKKATIEITSPLSDELHNSSDMSGALGIIDLNEKTTLKDRISRNFSRLSYGKQDAMTYIRNTSLLLPSNQDVSRSLPEAIRSGAEIAAIPTLLGTAGALAYSNGLVDGSTIIDLGKAVKTAFPKDAILAGLGKGFDVTAKLIRNARLTNTMFTSVSVGTNTTAEVIKNVSSLEHPICLLEESVISSSNTIAFGDLARTPHITDGFYTLVEGVMPSEDTIGTLLTGATRITAQINERAGSAFEETLKGLGYLQAHSPLPEVSITKLTSAIIDPILDNPMMATAVLVSAVGIVGCKYKGITLSDAKTAGVKAFKASTSFVVDYSKNNLTALKGTISDVRDIPMGMYEATADIAASTFSTTKEAAGTAYAAASTAANKAGAAITGAVSSSASSIKSFFSWGGKTVEAEEVPATKSQKAAASQSSQNQGPTKGVGHLSFYF
ncbi:MAG: hypothetical protein Q8L98_05085 [Chlamydiales bacterium]|nr:hypothetical protein [Chlamydiales bacterium]